ncbi:hypothetical protein ACFL35_15340 [Candidatus Riflebacteria bacterium]
MGIFVLAAVIPQFIVLVIAIVATSIAGIRAKNKKLFFPLTFFTAIFLSLFAFLATFYSFSLEEKVYAFTPIFYILIGPPAWTLVVLAIILAILTIIFQKDYLRGLMAGTFFASPLMFIWYLLLADTLFKLFAIKIHY